MTLSGMLTGRRIIRASCTNLKRVAVFLTCCRRFEYVRNDGKRSEVKMRTNHVWVFVVVSALGLGCWGNKKDNKKKEKAKDDAALVAGGERELTRDEALRERPDLGDVPVVARVSAGTKLDIVEMKESWVKVRSKDGQAQGWLPKEALVPLPALPETSAAEATAGTTPAPATGPGTAAASETGGTSPATTPAAGTATAAATNARSEGGQVVKWTWVRVRKTPDGEVAGRLTEGTAVEVSARERVKNKEWVKIAASQGDKSVSGWIAAGALTSAKGAAKKAGAAERTPGKATVKGQAPTPTTDDPSAPAPTKRTAKKGATRRSTDSADDASGVTGGDETIKWSTVRLRSAPSTKSKVLADMPKGTKVSVVKRRGEWLKVEAQISGQAATTGWVIAKATKAKDTRETESVTSTARTADSDSATREIAWKYVNLRSKPSTTDGKIVGKWTKGFAVKVVSTDGDWTRVRAAAKTAGARVGWVKSAALGETGDADAAGGVKRKARAETVTPSRGAAPESDAVEADTKRGKAKRRAVTLAKSAVATTDPGAAGADDEASDDLPPPPKKVVKAAPAKPKTKVSLMPAVSKDSAATLPLPTESKPVASKAAASTTAAASATKPGTTTIGWPVVQVRDEPDGRIVGELKRGVRVAELARDGEWVKVRANDTTGWIVDQAIAKP
jgi:uncharacterized protein YgiM (DUF1202 family)